MRIAKLLGAGRVVAAGRNERVLNTLSELGADAITRLDAPAKDIAEAFACEARRSGFHVVIDYVWGTPAEAFMAAITRREFAASSLKPAMFRLGRAPGRRSHFQLRCCVAPR